MKKLDKNNRAQAMIMVFVYIGVVSICAVAIMYYAAGFNQAVVYQLNHAQGYYAAEAGLVHRITELYNGTACTDSFNLEYLFGVGNWLQVSLAQENVPSGLRITAIVSNWR
ncbi:MAG: hypothetical protein KKB82_02650 [Candidatus Omnitrophica bacterium]|nr:hypothetical protein [Candidatus Omnitrophota bacterium]MBU1924805.1 hypothetical protein [Candidatus Omnitrophota bacterium]